MMATAGPASASGMLLLLETLEDRAVGHAEHTDAYLTIASRLSGDEGRQFLPAVDKYFCLLANAILGHMSSPSPELSQAALQALGFCVYHSHVAARLSETFAGEVLSELCSLVVKSTDKNTCTRALWVISKQSFPADVVSKKVSTILGSVESVWVRDDVQSVIMEHEALNVVIRLLEQVPSAMGEEAVWWAKLVVPLVVHSASKVRLRAAAALEMGMPLLLQRQAEVAAVIEPMMSTKLIPELQKLFMSKNESNVLKLWPLFVKLLGKLLHRGGPFINSLLHLEELGFRSSSPGIKKIAFIAWKSLIDNFALNPDILCSAKRMKLLMQPLSSIHVRTEALLLTKVEVWWYLVVQLGPNLSSNFDQVSVPLLQCAFGLDSSAPVTPARSSISNGAASPATPKSAFSSSAGSSWLALNHSVHSPSSFPSIQLLGLEMLLHYFLGPEAAAAAAQSKLTLSLEPLSHPLLSGASSFNKHAAVLISSVRDGFSCVGKDASESLLTAIWTSLLRFVNLAIESGGSKKDRQGGEALTLTLQALQSAVDSELLPADALMALLEVTVQVLPSRVLGSASYQVGKMDVLNGTPALFLVLLLYGSGALSAPGLHDRFFGCLQTLVACGLSGPASPLAFAEAVLAAASRGAPQLHSKEVLWRMWSVVVGPLTDTITQTNEVNQGDALEHNFSAVHSALMFPVTRLLQGAALPQASQKSLLASWSKLYRVFARCSALVVTAEENICCEELSAKMAAAIDQEALTVPSTAGALAAMLQVMVECVDFSPYSPQFQQKLKSPHTPVSWTRKKNRALGNLSSFLSLLVRCLHVHLDAPGASCEATPPALLAVLSALFSNLALASAVREALGCLVPALARLYGEAGGELHGKAEKPLEKLLSEILGCLQSRSSLAFDSELLALLAPLLCAAFPHRNKQIRLNTAHFWNATFANTVSLSYPDEIRPVLLQLKQKTPIILPGFQVSDVPDELGGLDSSESSQLETRVSGIAVPVVGLKDCRVSLQTGHRDKTPNAPKAVSIKLDFGSPKLPRRDVLEEEASIDFVFIPPEAKERVLTEHQKEVKRTKRVDIPAMYNNLDASLDTTAFSQYTQSQEDSLDKPPTQLPAVAAEGPAAQIPQPEVETQKVPEVVTQESREEKETADVQKQDLCPDPAGVSVEEDAETPEDTKSKESPGLNASSSSDLVSGTPQKVNSRRQSFITLEKYPEGKSGSPSTVSSFTGPLVKTSRGSSQTPPSPKTTSPPDSAESPRRPKESLGKTDPVRLTERLHGDPAQEDDVIPDTQNQDRKKSLETAAVSEEPESASRREEVAADDSQPSANSLRQPGHPRVLPLPPGEDNSQRDAKITHFKRRLSQEEPQSEPVQVRRNTRSQQAAEEMSRTIRTRSKGDEGLSRLRDSQGKPRKRIKLFSSSEDLLERRRKSSGGFESSQTDYDSQSSRRRGRPKRPFSTGSNVSDKEESSPNVNEPLELTKEPELRNESQVESFQSADGSQDSKPAEQTEKDQDGSNEGSQDASPSKKQSQEPMEEVSSSGMKSSDKTNETSIPNRHTRGLEETEDSAGLTPSSESQPQRRSKRIKASPETLESQDQGKDSQKRQTRSNSQTANQAEVQSGGRTTRRRSAPATGASGDSSASETSDAKESSVNLAKKGKTHRASLQSPLIAVSPKETTGVDDASQKDSPDAEVPHAPGNTEDKSRTEVEEAVPPNADQPPAEAQQRDSETSDEAKAESSRVTEEERPKKDDEHDTAATPATPAPPDETPQGVVSEPTEAEVDPERGPDCHQHPEEDGETEKDSEKSQVQDEEEHQRSEIPAEKDASSEPEDNRDPETEDNRDPETEDNRDPETEDNRDPETEDNRDPETEDNRDPETEDNRDPETEDNRDPETEDNQDLETEDNQDLETEDNQDLKPQISEGLDDPTSSDKQLVHSAVGDLGRTILQDSPLKQKDLEAVMVSDVGQSPGGGKTKGTWSPSASPSSSILKKSQKRQLEADSPSPLVKSRRVSFANPIQQQETADDIDRRSPAVRSSSPRRSRGSSIPQPKLVTTPTKGLLILSPRNLHSSGFKSSKKCLISEMSQEPRPVSKHCIYPALVGCSVPVEAVLPQISNVWSRGFGQLVRARNIKTVGDLSALTPSEVKALPIRSPKISNVRKALQTYEQQRKGRSGDELKSFDETERMVEETSAPQTADEDEKTSGETLATELLDDVVAEQPEVQQVSEASGVRGVQLLSHLQALSSRMTPAALGRWSPRQLVDAHELLADAHQLLGGLMRGVAKELGARIGHAQGAGPVPEDRLQGAGPPVD